MFGLCMPTGKTYLLLNDGTIDCIMMNDESHPKKFITNSKDVLEAIKKRGYKNVDAILYKYNNHTTKVSMADYYAEHGQELESK